MRLLAFAALLFATVSCGAALPSVIQDERAHAPRGKVTIVFFTDFQCPYCRRTHAALAPVLADHADGVHLVLRHVPLPSHPDARSAARAAICAEQLGLGAEYANALFLTPDLSEPACEQLAVDRGLDRDRFRQCVGDGATDERIERDTAIFDAASGDGVPLLYIGRTRLEGQQAPATLEAVVRAAIEAEK